MPSNQYIGRREAIGLGIEATPGVAVAPQTFLRWLSQDVMNKTDVVENESAMGVVAKVNDSEVVAKWAEGKIGGKVTDLGIGFLLTGFFGSPTTGTAVSGVYPHTFTMSQNSLPSPALTISRVNPVNPQRHSYGVIDSLELTAEAGGWVEVEAAVKARVGTTASDVAAFASEKEFTSKHITLQIGADAASAASSSPLSVSRVQLSLTRDSDPFNALGTDDKPEFDRKEFTASGEFVLRYVDGQYETDFLANAVKAGIITMANGNSSLAFSMNRVRYRELERSTDKDNVVTMTVSFAAELDLTAGNIVSALLKNSRSAYVAAQ